MLALLAVVLFAQTPLDETAAVRALIDTNLVSVTGTGMRGTFSRGAKSFTLADEEWRTAFALVPEAQTLALSAREANELGNMLFRIGTGIQLGGLLGAGALLLVTVLAAPVAIATVLALAFTCAGLALVGGVISIIGLPSMVRAQTESYETVSRYNHGLTRLGAGTLLSVPLGH